MSTDEHKVRRIYEVRIMVATDSTTDVARTTEEALLAEAVDSIMQDVADGSLEGSTRCGLRIVNVSDIEAEFVDEFEGEQKKEAP